MFCSYCGAENENNALFCTQCGSRIEKTVEPVVQVPVEPVVQVPVEPAVQVPVEPAVQAPVEPAVQAPVVTAPQTPVAPLYSEPVYVQPEVVANSRSNGLAIAALIVSGVGFLFNWILALLGWFFAVPGLIMAIIAKLRTPKSGVSTAALIVSIVTVVACLGNSILGFILGLLGFYSY